MFEMNAAKMLDPVTTNKTWIKLSSLFSLVSIDCAFLSKGALFNRERVEEVILKVRVSTGRIDY